MPRKTPTVKKQTQRGALKTILPTIQLRPGLRVLGEEAGRIVILEVTRSGAYKNLSS